MGNVDYVARLSNRNATLIIEPPRLATKTQTIKAGENEADQPTET
jgi:hypothetical protein